jgi:Holliday junction resolvase-like predicted endonuclease
LPSSIANASPDLAHTWLGPALGLAIGLAVGAVLMALFRARREQALARARNQRGRRGEERAVQLLTAAGYEIVARQQRTSYLLRKGTQELRVGLAFDFVVKKDGKLCVAEVKTGAGTELKHAETRRQLLEYQLASGGSEVLLVDPEREHICQVSFPLDRPAPAAQTSADEPTPSTWPLVVCIAVGVLSLYLWAR